MLKSLSLFALIALATSASPGDPTCALGDRASWCPTIEPYRCYTDSDTCCGTCANLIRVDLPAPIMDTCRYGDKVSAADCAANLASPSRCYTDEENCCGTCAQVCLDVAECRYGDKAGWCSSITANMCYEPSTESTCCKTCADFRRGTSTCLYGDRVAGCSTADCNDPARAGACCETCTPNIAAAIKVKPAGYVYPCAGEDAYWCRFIQEKDCYNHPDACCNTCRTKFYTYRMPAPAAAIIASPAAYVKSGSAAYLTSGQAAYVKSGAPAYLTSGQAAYVKSGAPAMIVSRGANIKSGSAAFLTSGQGGYVKSGAPAMILSGGGNIKSGSAAYLTSGQAGYVKSGAPAMIVSGGAYMKSGPAAYVASNLPAFMRSGCMDQASWCPSLAGSYCYEDNTRSTCCSRCGALRMGPVGCEYGDYMANCMEADCADPTMRTKCCRTCGAYNMPYPGSLIMAQNILGKTGKTQVGAATVVEGKPSFVITPSDPSRVEEEATVGKGYNIPQMVVNTDLVDKEDWCYNVKPHECYHPSVDYSCPRTCYSYESYQLSLVGPNAALRMENCRYGNKYSWCSGSYCNSAQNVQDCCGSCNMVAPGVVAPMVPQRVLEVAESCQNTAPWCTQGFHKAYCYNDETRDQTCCYECAKIRDDSIEGCEYGDRKTWCDTIRLSSCSKPEIASDCCDKCSNYSP